MRKIHRHTPFTRDDHQFPRLSRETHNSELGFVDVVVRHRGCRREREIIGERKKTRTKLTINTISFNENGCGRLDSLICEVHGRLGRGHRFNALRVYYAPPPHSFQMLRCHFFSRFVFLICVSVTLSLSLGVLKLDSSNRKMRHTMTHVTTLRGDERK